MSKQTGTCGLRAGMRYSIELPASSDLRRGRYYLSGEAARKVEAYTGPSHGLVPALLWEKTIVWEAGELPHVAPVRFGAGIGLLDTWELAVPLCNYKTLAAHIGTEEERERTQKIILDLRVPLYETACLSADADTERLPCSGGRGGDSVFAAVGAGSAVLAPVIE
jgi:hypothetical protein